MPQLNRDLLREVLYEIVKTDGSFKNIDKFMMAGKEQFQLVLDYCMQADDVILYSYDIVAKLPHCYYLLLPVDKEFLSRPVNVLFKPISVALASTMKSVDLRCFSSELIPVLKSVDWEMIEVYLSDYKKQFKTIFDACVNIPNVHDRVILANSDKYYLLGAMKFFAIPCHKLTIYDGNNIMYISNKKIDLQNPYLQNILDLTIEGKLFKKSKYLKDVQQFVTFISTNFPNLETFNADIDVDEKSCWDWNDFELANIFKALPPGLNGSATFKIEKRGFYEVDRNKYPDVRRNGNKYYHIYPVTNTFSLKLITTFREVHQNNLWFWDNLVL